MREKLSSKVFSISFFAVYFGFVIATMYLFEFSSPGFGVGHVEYGFPFKYYYSHCFGGYYIWTGLVANLTVGAVFSFLTALSLENLRRKLSSPEFRARWHI